MMWVSKFKQHCEIRKMAVIFECQASLTFFLILLLNFIIHSFPQPHSHCSPTLAGFFLEKYYCLWAWKAKCSFIPIIIVDIIASYGYYDFWQWLFCKTNQRFLNAHCVSSLQLSFSSFFFTTITKNWQWRRKENNCRSATTVDTTPTFTHMQLVKLIFSLVIINWRNIHWSGTWMVVHGKKPPEVRFNWLCIHYHYIITTIIINFKNR